MGKKYRGVKKGWVKPAIKVFSINITKGGSNNLATEDYSVSPGPSF